MSSKGLEMPVTGSDKLELPVLGCRFGEKAEHLPIKKRRFLFTTSSPPHNTVSSEVTETVATCLNSSSQEVQPKPVATCPPAESLTVANQCQNGSIDNKVHEEKLDISLGSGIGSYGIKSLIAPLTVKLEANSVNLPNISAKETGLRISTVPFKDDDCSSKATVDNNSTLNSQVTSQGQKSGVCDERLNWDLNTVMAWEESPECNHNIHTSTPYAAQGIKGISKGCKQEQECGTASENIANKILTNLRSLGHHTVHGKEPVERKPNSNHINKLLFPVISSIPPPSPHVTVSNIKPTVKLEYPPPCPMPAGIGLSLDYSKSKPPSFDCTRSSQENAALSTKVGSGSNINHVSTAVVETSENENLNLSLVTVASVEKKVDEEDDKAKVKRVITSSCITTQDAYKPINQSTTIGSLLVIQSSVSPEGENQPSTVSDAQVPIKPEKSPSTSTPPSVSYHKQVCQVPLDNGFGFGFENEIQRSEVDNADEFSFGYEESQFEDGEVRESSIQTWEGSEGDNRENQHPTTDNKKNNSGTCGGSHECVPESSSRIKSTEISGSQKGTTDEISSVLLPEKPDTSEQVSNNSEPNETNTREVSIKDESESDQWKMNVSGSETLLPDDYGSVNKTKDLKPYKREPFINRGSRFRMQGYSSSNGDDSGSRSREIRPFKRGKYSPHVRTSNRVGATWNRSPGRERDPPFFRDVDNLTNEACLEQNDDAIRPPRQSFRTRLVGNRDEDDFRARLGLRPAGDTRFVGRGRSLRYSSRGGGGRYGGPANGGYDEPLEYSQPFPRRRCFSPTERRENNHPCVHHHSDSTSPPRSRTRSRSPRIRRPRSPNYRFETGGYNVENRWVKYKQQSTVFNRSPPPIGERLTFYDSPRNKKQNESYRSGPHTGRMSGDVHGGGVVMDHGYRNGGFVKRHEMGRPVKHMEYDEEDGYGLEFHGRGNPRFRDLSRRGNPREERENW